MLVHGPRSSHDYNLHHSLTRDEHNFKNYEHEIFFVSSCLLYFEVFASGLARSFRLQTRGRADRSGSHAVPRKSGEETVAAFTTKTRRRKGTQDSPGFFVPSRLRGERQASDYSALSLEEFLQGELKSRRTSSPSRIPSSDSRVAEPSAL